MIFFIINLTNMGIQHSLRPRFKGFSFPLKFYLVPELFMRVRLVNFKQMFKFEVLCLHPEQASILHGRKILVID